VQRVFRDQALRLNWRDLLSRGLTKSIGIAISRERWHPKMWSKKKHYWKNPGRRWISSPAVAVFTTWAMTIGDPDQQVSQMRRKAPSRTCRWDSSWQQ